MVFGRHPPHARLTHRFRCASTSGDPVIPAFDTGVLQLLSIVATAALGGAINSIAGGGTLLTFPALVALGIPAITANATSTVALVPGAFSSFFGYRRELQGVRRFALWVAVPSVLGGLAGALLLLVTPSARFDSIVPWLVLGATALFVVQRPLLRLLRTEAGAGRSGMSDPAAKRPPPLMLAYQLLVSIYGGYFGAGLGILMLAAFGFMGFTNIHRMNGLKSWAGTCANLVAAVTFSVSGMVDWRVAGAMAVGAIVGGFGGSSVAQRVSQDTVRAAVVAIGLASGIWLFF